ncbi:GntR family transcriptional regulator [Pseudonocardia sp. T1-2H]|uniref:GntR family transcriptional regulator n=1 Tax=Pseudonocardia sp. T1-2H TaxID=3128899 RepID=UPI00310156AB
MAISQADEDSAALASAQSATDRAYSTILRNTLTGKYRAGERLTESRLTADLGLSRIPVREALKRLALDGVIDLHRHRGATIRVTTRRDIAEFFQVRSMLESNSAAAAAGRIREPSCDAERGRLIDHMLRLQEWTAAPESCGKEEYAKHNHQFHQLIIDLGGNQLVVKFWDSLQLPVQRLSFFQRYRLADLKASMNDHFRIAESILAGDSRAAERYAREHSNRVAAAVHGLPDHEFNLVLNPGLISSPGDM